MPHILDNRLLVPDTWKKNDAGPLHVFNPGLLRAGKGWILAYRVVLADGVRRIALCRLNERLAVIPGSVVPFSDLVTFRNKEKLPPQAHQWFADPRLYRLQNRCLLHWNSGWHEPRNYQFLIEFDEATLRPVQMAREITTQGPRQAIEKNWTFWGDKELYAIYTPSPFKVMKFSLEGEGNIVFEPVHEHRWENRIYERRFGQLRGGCPPFKLGDRMLSLCHSMHGTRESGFDYEAAAFAFKTTAPFAPVDAPHRPIPLPPPPPRKGPQLNKAVGKVLYPCGAALDGNDCLISYGLNDEACAIIRIPKEQILGSLIPVQS